MSENNWTPTPLGEILEIKYGKDHKHLADGEFPVFGSGGIMRYAEKPLYDKPSILIPRKGTLSNLFYVDKPFWSVDTMFYTKINEQHNSKYIYYFLKSIDLAALNVGSAVPSLTTEVLNNVEIKLPNRKTQDKIASILSSLDDKIELNNQMNQTLEQIAQAIFKEWFVDFNFPGFDGNLVDGVPKGWKYDNLGNHLKTVLGGTPSTKNEEFWKNGTIGWINSGKVNEFRITEPSQLITEDAVRSSSTKLLPAKTIVIAITGATLGQISRLEIDACANQSVVGILENGELSSEYIYLWLNNNIAYLLRSATGGAQPHVNKNNVNELDLLIPDSKILALFNSKVSSLFDKISNNCMENLILEKTRNSLLPRLLSKN